MNTWFHYTFFTFCGLPVTGYHFSWIWVTWGFFIHRTPKHIHIYFIHVLNGIFQRFLQFWVQGVVLYTNLQYSISFFSYIFFFIKLKCWMYWNLKKKQYCIFFFILDPLIVCVIARPEFWYPPRHKTTYMFYRADVFNFRQKNAKIYET